MWFLPYIIYSLIDHVLVEGLKNIRTKFGHRERKKEAELCQTNKGIEKQTKTENKKQ